VSETAYPFPVKIATKSTDSLADGSSGSVEFDFSEDYIIEAILLNRSDGQPWSGSMATVQVGPTAITDPNAPCSVFGTDWLTRLPLGIYLKAQEKVKVSVTNNEGTTITVHVTLVLKKP